MSREAALKIGDHVRVRGTPATLALELAGQVGQVQSIVSAGELAVEPIGVRSDAAACEVYLESRGASFWIMAPLLLPLDAATQDGQASNERDVGRSSFLSRLKDLIKRRPS